MKVLKKGAMSDGTKIQIEEWSEDYSFMPYGRTIGVYAKSKMSHEGSFTPKGNEIYRFEFDFNSNKENVKARVAALCNKYKLYE